MMSSYEFTFCIDECVMFFLSEQGDYNNYRRGTKLPTWKLMWQISRDTEPVSPDSAPLRGRGSPSKLQLLQPLESFPGNADYQPVPRRGLLVIEVAHRIAPIR